MPEEQQEIKILRLSIVRRREIMFALAWRGILYSCAALGIAACFTYLFANEAWHFFLNPSMKLNKDEAAFLYLWLAVPAVCFGWFLAFNHVMHVRFSHFRIALIEEPRRVSWLSKLIAGTDRDKRRKY